MASLSYHCASFRLVKFPKAAASPQQDPSSPEPKIGRREVVLRSSGLATIAALFHFSGSKPNYLGVQKNPPVSCNQQLFIYFRGDERSKSLCPAMVSFPRNYNPEDGQRKKSISREEAMAELLQVINSTKPDNFTPRIMEKKEDYIRVEYESPIMGFVDDVEFWFPPGKKSLVQYRSASRLGNFDFDINRKRIKALRLALERKGWVSESSF